MISAQQAVSLFLVRCYIRWVSHRCVAQGVKSRGHDVIQTLHIIIALRSFLSGTKQAIARHHHTFIRVRHSSCTLTAARKLVTKFFCFNSSNIQGRKK